MTLPLGRRHTSFASNLRGRCGLGIMNGVEIYKRGVSENSVQVSCLCSSVMLDVSTDPLRQCYF